MESFLETGEIVSTHGVRGELKIYPWADSPDFLLKIKEFRIGETNYRVERSRVQGTCVLVKLAGVDTVEAAQVFRGKTVLFDKTKIKPDKGHYIADLIGLSVRYNGKEIGKLTNVLQYPGNDVWEVKGQREYLIPAVPAFLQKVCVEEGYADVLLLEGMAVDEN